jgi:plastocyanin
MHQRTLRLFVVTLLVLLVAPAVAGSEPTPAIEAVNENGYYGEHHYWRPSTATVTAGGAVNLSNPTVVNHGVEWKSGPGTPSCSSGVPVGTSPAASGSGWSGTCTFAQPGVYTFYCTVHGAEMVGTITVNTPPPPSVKKVSPKKGPAETETTVTITGKSFTGATAVEFGSIAAASFTVTSSTSIVAVAPAEPVGKVDVRVTTPSGTSAIVRRDHFKFRRPR